MSFEEKFDKIIRQKAEESSFPFEQANWEQASRMIDAERGLAKAGKTGLSVKTIALVAALALLLAGGVNYFTTNKPALTETVNNTRSVAPQTTETAPTALKASGASPASSNMATEATTAPPLTANATNSAKEKVTKQLKSAPESETRVEDSKTTQTSSEVIVAQKKSLSPKTENYQSTANPATELAQIPSSFVKAKRETNNTGERIASDGKHEATTSNDPERIDESSKTDAAEKNTNVYKAGNESVKTNVAVNANVTQNTLNDGGIPAPVNGTELPETERDVETQEVLNLDRIDLALSKDENAKLPELVFFERYDEDFYKKGIKYKTHFLNIEAGADYMPGWVVKGGKDGKGLDWFGGLNYGLYITRKFIFGIGMQLYDIKNINQPFYSTEKTDYGFGSSSTSSVITANELYYAAVPVKIYYKLNRYNMVALGLNAGYLYKVKNNVTTSYSNEQAPLVTHNTKVYSSLETMNYMLNLSYRTRLARRFWVSAEGCYGITDMFKNNANFANTEKAMGVRLSIQYTLFDK